MSSFVACIAFRTYPQCDVELCGCGRETTDTAVVVTLLIIPALAVNGLVAAFQRHARRRRHRSTGLCSCLGRIKSQVLRCGGQREGPRGGQPPLRRDSTRFAALMQLDMTSLDDLPYDMMAFAGHEDSSVRSRRSWFETSLSSLVGMGCVHVVSDRRRP